MASFLRRVRNDLPRRIGLLRQLVLMRVFIAATLLLLSAPVLAVLPNDYEPYSSRPDIVTVKPKAHPELDENWVNLKRAHVEAIAQMVESYPEHELYFLARDSEYLYDLAKLLLRGDSVALKRLHLINISRANMNAEHVEEYLEQEGISEATLRAGKKVMLIDTGFSGTIPRNIQSHFPEELRSSLQAHLLASSNPDHPSSRVFLE